MRITHKKMKHIVLILLLVPFVLPALSQELSPREQRKLAKEIKKEQKAEELTTSSALVSAMVKQATYVLEANQLRNKQGASLMVTSDLNFVAADSTTGVLQIGDDAGLGPNGVGGITVEGRITEYKVTENKKGAFTVTYYLQTHVGTYDIRLTAFPNGRAEATMSNATWGGRITFSGRLVPPGLSRVYKGMAL